MITAAYVIRGGARIAQAKPPLADRIAAEVVKVARARYQTPECRNVAIGHAILALGEFFDLLNRPGAVLQFVRQQVNNSRPATRKKAEQFLKRDQSCAKDLPTWGADPEDERSFGASRLQTLRQATSDLCWLLDHGYGIASATELVGDRYHLTWRQRIAIARCACSGKAKERRDGHCVAPPQLRGQELWLDGLNVLTAVETALGAA
jgi:hypothetical protein